MRAFCSWSGGKDAALALHRAREAGVVVERGGYRVVDVEV
jgi:diphthamide synthase (EF-2-diphthine--ammonia ligase)